MVKIFDYKCTFENDLKVSDKEISDNNIIFPDTYTKVENIVKYAKLRKKVAGVSFVELPFCHTVLAEAYGGIINYGNALIGPRTKEFAYKDINKILDIKRISFDAGRISEYLKSARLLSEDGEDVVYEVEGPLTILNNLVDTNELFKTLKRDKELIKKVFKKIEIDIYYYINEILKRGVRYISFADPSAAVSIVGPKIVEEYIDTFANNFIINVLNLFKKYDAMMLLCPKLTIALYSLKRIKFNNTKLSGEINYFEALKENIGKVHLTGQMCIKNRTYILRPAILKELVFT